MIEQGDEFWWKDITGPRAFVRKVTEDLLEGRIPLLYVPADLPWRHSMRNAVVDLLAERRSDLQPYVSIIDAADDCPGGNVGEFLLGKFADSDTASAYRVRSGMTLQQYLVRQGVLSDKIIWVKGLSPENLQAWLDFCRGFESCSLTSGTFIIESSASTRSPLPGLFSVVEFVDYVTRHDVMLFNAVMLADRELPMSRLRQDYVSVAAAYLCDFDAELSEALLLGDMRWFSTDPGEMLRELVQEEPFSRRGGSGKSPHVLFLLKEGREREVMQRLWRAQVQVLFPILEMQRVWLIEQFRGQLEELLKNEVIEQFGQRVCFPEELELGALVFLMARRSENGVRSLYVPDEFLRQAIRKLRDCRNLLAHRHQCCTPEQVEFILSFEERRTERA